MQGVWVYEIGTLPYFTNVAPGEVPYLPTEAPSPEIFHPEEVEEIDGGSPGFDRGQQVEYPTLEPEGVQIQVHPVQYQPGQPGNPEVLVVEDTDINVDGRCSENFHTEQCFLLCSHCLCARLQCSPTTSGLVRAAETRVPSLLTARTTPVDTAVAAGLASMATEYSALQRVIFCFRCWRVHSDVDVGRKLFSTFLKQIFQFNNEDFLLSALALWIIVFAHICRWKRKGGGVEK